MANEAETDGGKGEVRPIDMALYRRAFNAGWNVPPETRALVLAQMAKIVEHSDEERNKIAAAKVLVAADSVDARREATEEEKDKPRGSFTQNNYYLSPEQLSKLTPDELIRLHTETLALPGPDHPPGDSA